MSEGQIVILTIMEATDYLNAKLTTPNGKKLFCYASVYSYIKNGKIPSIKIGKRFFVHQEGLDGWLDAFATRHSEKEVA